MKTIETNKLIAEFMGGTLSSVPNLINLPQTRGDANIHSVKGSEMLPNGTYSVHRLNELKYHSSEDWLMPVVERIEQVIQGVPQQMLHLSLYSTIDEVYQAVVEFIKEYNKDYKTCDRCCFDIVDDDGDIMEHICIDDKLF